jgi:hypothetical protein
MSEVHPNKLLQEAVDTGMEVVEEHVPNDLHEQDVVVVAVLGAQDVVAVLGAQDVVVAVAELGAQDVVAAVEGAHVHNNTNNNTPPSEEDNTLQEEVVVDRQWDSVCAPLPGPTLHLASFLLSER